MRRHAALHELVRDAGAFAVSILASGQEQLAQHFARGVPPIGLWIGIETTIGELGAPLIEGALGWVECRLASEVDAGDHTSLRRLGRVGPPRPGPGGARPPAPRVLVIEAVVFDLDGVLLDTEEVWDEARRQIAAERGGRWPEDAQQAMMGMSSPEWSRYMHDVVGLTEPPEEISAEVVARLEALYRERLPLIDGAIEAVRRIGSARPLAIASSSNRPLIDLFLELTGTGDLFRATVSSEEVARGKPAPDVYLEAARRLGAAATRLRGDRGLRERDPLGGRGGHAGACDPEPRLPAERGGARARGRRPRVAGRAHGRSRRRASGGRRRASRVS